MAKLVQSSASETHHSPSLFSSDFPKVMDDSGSWMRDGGGSTGGWGGGKVGHDLSDVLETCTSNPGLLAECLDSNTLFKLLEK